MTAPHITTRSRHYSPTLRAELNAYSAQDAAENARLWREIAADAIGVPRDWAIAAYWQSIADRKRAAENAKHAPVMITSPDGSGIASQVGCACGQRPTIGVQSRAYLHVWIAAHYARHGLTFTDPTTPRAVYAPELPGAGMTPEQWYDRNPELNPFTGLPRFADIDN
jgi:hypothetical protein